MSKIENREAAYDALKLAKSKLEAGDTDGAQRFALKSIGLYETAEAQQFQKEIQEAIEQERTVRRVLDAPTFFEVLGVGRTVLAAEAKKAFLKISRDVHPDKNKHPSAAQAFQKLNEAHTTLANPQQRDAYAFKNPPRPTGAHYANGRQNEWSGGSANGQSHQYWAGGAPPTGRSSTNPQQQQPTADPWKTYRDTHGQHQSPQRQQPPPRAQQPPRAPPPPQPQPGVPQQPPPQQHAYGQAANPSMEQQISALRYEIATQRGLIQSLQGQVRTHEASAKAGDMLRETCMARIAKLEQEKRELESRGARAEHAAAEAAKRLRAVEAAQAAPNQMQRQIGDLSASLSEALRQCQAEKQRADRLEVSLREEKEKATKAAAIHAAAAAAPPPPQQPQAPQPSPSRATPAAGGAPSTAAAAAAAKGSSPPFVSPPAGLASGPGFVSGRQRAVNAEEEEAPAPAADPPNPAPEQRRSFGNVPLSQQQQNAVVAADDDEASAAADDDTSAEAVLARVSAERLRLRPLVNDGREVIHLANAVSKSDADDDTASLGHVIIGRQSREKPNPFGVKDPRVSRRHVRVDIAAAGSSVTIMAIGTNPIAKLTQARASSEGAPALPYQRDVLTHGEKAVLRVGDMVQLVVEERVPASGPSIDYASNPCVYVLEAGPEKRPREPESSDPSEQRAEPEEANGSSSRQPVKLPKTIEVISVI